MAPGLTDLSGRRSAAVDISGFFVIPPSPLQRRNGQGSMQDLPSHVKELGPGALRILRSNKHS